MIIKIVLFLLFSTSTFAYKGDEVGNGGGLGENNILYAYYSLGIYIKQCLVSELCEIDEQQRELLDRINRSLAQEYNFKNQIRFKSGIQNPGFFVDENGYPRSARTGGSIGTVIWFNLDDVYSRERGYTSIPQATSMLIHELGHHHGMRDHTYLDNLGAKVAKLLNNKLLVLPYGNIHSNIVAQIFRAEEPVASGTIDSIMISDDQKYFSLSGTITSVAKCPMQEDKMVAISILQGGWNYRTIPAYLEVYMVYYCESSSNRTITSVTGNFLQFFPNFFVRTGGKLEISSIEYRFVHCDPTSSECLASLRKERSNLTILTKEQNHD